MRSLTPKLFTMLREGHNGAMLRADAVAGLTVAIVALPLSMAIAVVSGTTPDCGLYAAIVGGFLVSLLGGSRFQIGGPAGAFIVLVAACVERQGIDGMLLATVTRLLRGPRGIAAMLLATFLLTVFIGLVQGIAAGLAIAALQYAGRRLRIL